MNNFFINITKNSNLKPYKDSSLTNINEITSNFNNDISIKVTKEFFSNIVSDNFNFQEVAREGVKKEIINLNVKNSLTNGPIPAIILKQYVDIYLPFLIKVINHAITENTFPEQSKSQKLFHYIKRRILKRRIIIDP